MTPQRSRRIILRGVVAHRHEADDLLKTPGDAVLVRRGVDRSVAIQCPDGCGEKLTINLDPRTGPAWRSFQTGEMLTLFPSVWRRTGCLSHFIVWCSRIYWCDWGDPLEVPSEDIVQRTLSSLTGIPKPYPIIANSLGLEPWAVLSACTELVKRGLAVRGLGDDAANFRRR
jgi:Family of unknown function (DUF6527)